MTERALMQGSWIKAVRADQLPSKGKVTLELDGRFVVLVRDADGVVHCVDDVCTHDGGPLGDGELDGFCLVCPRHGARFDVRDGRPTMPATESIPCHLVQEEDGWLMVQLSDV
jgi:3-phenylpropionate/trans-cinnamate dioxygenase ferredoxin subunit